MRPPSHRIVPVLLVWAGSGCYVGPLLEGAVAGTSTGPNDDDDDGDDAGTTTPVGSSSGSISGETATTTGVTAVTGESTGASSGSGEPNPSSGEIATTTGATVTWDPIVADGDRLYFVGNSYTGNEGGLPEHIENGWPSAMMPLGVDTTAQYYYGQPLGSMFTTTVVNAIENGNFDTCTITSGTLGEMMEFVPVIDASCGHLVVYMTWGINPTLGSMNSYRNDTAAIVSNMRAVEEMTDARVVPSGLVFYDLIADPPQDGLREDWLYFPQNIHQNGAGTALNVYVFYAALVGESPVGIDYDLVYPWDGTVIVEDELVATRRATDGTYLYDEIDFDDAFRTALQERAWDVTAAWFAGTTEFD